jgi:hypothetical protein
VIHRAWDQERRTRSKDPLFECGPVKYLGDTLREYKLSWADTLGDQYSPKPDGKPKAQQREWYTECRKRDCEALAGHYLSERSALPKYLRARVPSTFEETLKVVLSKKVAPFLAECLGRAALRLQAPNLTTCPSTPRAERAAVRAVRE